MKTIEKALEIINTKLDRNNTPAEILALKEAESLEVGLNLIVANRGLIIDFDISKHKAIDWSKVPIDTPIFVRGSEAQEWKPRHFYAFRDELVYAFKEGKTSHTAEQTVTPWFHVRAWPYAKLAKPEDI